MLGEVNKFYYTLIADLLIKKSLENSQLRQLSSNKFDEVGEVNRNDNPIKYAVDFQLSKQTASSFQAHKILISLTVVKTHEKHRSWGARNVVCYYFGKPCSKTTTTKISTYIGTEVADEYLGIRNVGK